MRVGETLSAAEELGSANGTAADGGVGSLGDLTSARGDSVELMASPALPFSHSGGVLTCARPWLLKPWVGGRCVGAIPCRFQHPWARTHCWLR